MMATSLGVLFGTREPATPRNERAATCGALGSPPSKTCAPPRAAVGATTCRGKAFSKRTQKRGVAVVRKACRNHGSGVTAKSTPRAAVGASLENMFGAHLAVASATSSKTCRTPRAAAGAPPPEKNDNAATRSRWRHVRMFTSAPSTDKQTRAQIHRASRWQPVPTRRGSGAIGSAQSDTPLPERKKPVYALPIS